MFEKKKLGSEGGNRISSLAFDYCFDDYFFITQRNHRQTKKAQKLTVKMTRDCIFLLPKNP